MSERFLNRPSTSNFHLIHCELPKCLLGFFAPVVRVGEPEIFGSFEIAITGFHH